MIVEKILEQYSFSLLIGSLALLAGILVSKFFEKLTLKFLEKIRLKAALKRAGFEEMVEKFLGKFNTEKFLAQVVKWFFIVLALMAFFDALKLERVSSFFLSVVNYYPNIFISILIFLIAVYLLDFSKKVFVATLEKEKITFAPLVGRGFSVFVWSITILAILYQLKIVPQLISAIFFGFIFAISLSLGIAFGFGGKDFAQKILKDLEEKIIKK